MKLGKIKGMNDHGLGILEIIVIIALVAGVLLTVSAIRADAAEITQDSLQKMRFTCYCPESCPGTITASGAKVREGILACSRDHLGDGAMVYLMDGTFLGFYECLDTGGGAGLRNGTAVDVWTPNMAKAKELMRLTEGQVMIRWIKDPKG